MKISRREFLKYCTVSASAIGLSMTDIASLKELLANPEGPSIVWLQGSGCTGCSMSLINHVSENAPRDVSDLLINHIDLKYHPNLTSEEGVDVVSILEEEYDEGGYVLVIEGAVPTIHNGGTCLALTNESGEDITFISLVSHMAKQASHVIALGSCAAFGGIPAVKPNITKIKPLQEILPSKEVINITGCPPHPNSIIWPIVRILLGKGISLDAYGRPKQLYRRTVHARCERRGKEFATELGQPDTCLYNMGCRGPKSWGSCPSTKWNNGVSWCVESNAPCIGCTEATFPGNKPLYKIPRAY